MFEAVIFDMDGVIIDSEPLWEKTERLLLRNKGIEYDVNYRDKILGLNQKDSAALLKKEFGLHESIDEIIETRLDILLNIYENELRLKKDVLNLLEILNRKRTLTALASSSPKKVVDYVLKKFGLSKYFKTVTSGDCVCNGKPDPEIYISTALKLSVDTQKCIAIEDSLNGVRAAKSSGMYCIAVPDTRIDISQFNIANEIVQDISSLLNNRTVILRTC